MEKAISKMKEDWREMQFDLVPYRETVLNFFFGRYNTLFNSIYFKGVKILSSVDDIQLLLDDHIIKALTMLGSPYIKPLEVEAKEWSQRLQMIQEILDEWLKVNQVIYYCYK